MGLTHDTITFEGANGWNPVNGDGDMFAGSGAPTQEVAIPQLPMLPVETWQAARHKARWITLPLPTR